MSSSLGPTSRLLQYLPAVYQEPIPNQPPDGESREPARSLAEAMEPVYQAPYLQSYLLPYEEILLGLPGVESLLGEAGGGDLLHPHDAESLHPQAGSGSRQAPPGAGDVHAQSGTEGLQGSPGAGSRPAQSGAEYPPGAGEQRAQSDAEGLHGPPGAGSRPVQSGAEYPPGAGEQRAQSDAEGLHGPPDAGSRPVQPGAEYPPGAGEQRAQSGAEGVHGPHGEGSRPAHSGAEYPPGLSGAGDVLARGGSKSGLGLESVVAYLHRLFDPWKTPEEFLPWLAQWAALTLATGLPDRIRRKLLAEIIPLYRIRGTKHYLERLLAIYLRVPADVIDDLPALQVARHSTLGRDSYIGGGPPHFFRVVLRLSRAGGSELERQRRLAKYVIELAKPAHTDYALEISAPRFQLGVHSTVAMDTFL